MRITLVHMAALGDTMLLLPLLRGLRQMHPEVRLTVVTKSNLGQMLTMHGFVSDFASADAAEHARWFAAPAGEGPEPPPEWAACDILISAVSSGRDAWAQHAATAAPAAQRLFFEPRPPAEYADHVTAWHREQLAQQRLDVPVPPPLPVRVNPDGPVLIHPGSGGRAKCWPRENYLALGEKLRANGIIPTFLLGEAEEERWGRPLVKELRDAYPTFMDMGLFELSDRMTRARIYLGNDSGVTHLAAALGVPTLALFGPSNDMQWRPMGTDARVLRAAPPRERELGALETGQVLDALLGHWAMRG